MTYQHKQLAEGRWKNIPFFAQMANIGSEVARALKWKDKANAEYSRLALERALELLDLTKEDQKNRKRLKELCRLKEILVDAFDKNIYKSSAKLWEHYFGAFNYAANKRPDKGQYGKNNYF